MTTFKNRLAGLIGSSLEWYDFALYGCFAHLIAQHFFPQNDHQAALLGTFAVFAIGFLARPLGAIAFGHIGDRLGRRLPFLLSLYGITLPTLVIGVLPTYAQIGLWAPLLLLLARLVQGFMIGGEYTGALLFFAEDAPVQNRATRGALAMISALLGMLVGSLLATIMTSCFPSVLLSDWLWRAPFWLAFVLGSLGIVWRRQIIESSVFSAMLQRRPIETSPLKTLWQYHKRSLSLAIGICAMTGTTEYLLLAYLPSYMQQASHLPLHTILALNTAGMIVMLLCLKPLAAWSDRIGRRPLLLLAAIGFLAFSWPIDMLLTSSHVWRVGTGLLLFNLLLSLACAPMPALYMELFPTQVRYSGIAISYNLSFAMFAGTAPLLAKWMHGPTALIMISAVISGVCFYYMPETFKRSLSTA